MSFVFDIAAGKQASALGKYNQSVQDRNALVKEQEAEAIKKQTEFDIVKFDQQFDQLTGQTKVATLKSGVELSGSALNILRYNAEQAEIQKDGHYIGNIDGQTSQEGHRRLMNLPLFRMVQYFELCRNPPENKSQYNGKKKRKNQEEQPPEWDPI